MAAAVPDDDHDGSVQAAAVREERAMDQSREIKPGYRYMINRDDEPPTLIRLGSFAKMEAPIFIIIEIA